MFTDGLVERRGSRLDDRFTLLESSLRAAPSTEPDRVADFVIDAMTSDARSSDDIVVLAARRQGDDPGLDLRRRRPDTGAHAGTSYCDGMQTEAPLATLVGAHMPVPCLDGSRAPLPRPRLRRLHPGPAVGGGPGQRVPAVVLERAPRRGLQVRRATAAYEEARDSVHRFVRAGRPDGDDVVVLVRNTTEAHQPPGLPAGPGPRRRGGHHGRRAPRQPAALGPGRRHGAGWSAAPTGTFEIADVVRVLDDGRPPGPAGAHGSLQRHGLAAAGRGDLRRGARRGVPVLLDAAQLAPHRPLPDGTRLRGLQRPQAVRAVRCRRAHRATARSFEQRRSVPGRRRRGRPRRPRRGHLDGSARARGGRVAQRRRRGRLRDGHGRAGAHRLGRHRGPRGARCARSCTRACAPSTACGCSGRRRRRALREHAARRGGVHGGRHAPRPGGGPA